jgi:hypothetical protein
LRRRGRPGRHRCRDRGGPRRRRRRAAEKLLAEEIDRRRGHDQQHRQGQQQRGPAARGELLLPQSLVAESYTLLAERLPGGGFLHGDVGHRGVGRPGVGRSDASRLDVAAPAHDLVERDLLLGTRRQRQVFVVRPRLGFQLLELEVEVLDRRRRRRTRGSRLLFGDHQLLGNLRFADRRFGNRWR